MDRQMEAGETGGVDEEAERGPVVGGSSSLTK